MLSRVKTRGPNSLSIPMLLLLLQCFVNSKNSMRHTLISGNSANSTQSSPKYKRLISEFCQYSTLTRRTQHDNQLVVVHFTPFQSLKYTLKTSSNTSKNKMPEAECQHHAQHIHRPMFSSQLSKANVFLAAQQMVWRHHKWSQSARVHGSDQNTTHSKTISDKT